MAGPDGCSRRGPEDDKDESALFRLKMYGFGPWLFWTVFLLLMFKTCGVALWE